MYLKRMRRAIQSHTSSQRLTPSSAYCRVCASKFAASTILFTLLVAVALVALLLRQNWCRPQHRSNDASAVIARLLQGEIKRAEPTVSGRAMERVFEDETGAIQAAFRLEHLHSFPSGDRLEHAGVRC